MSENVNLTINKSLNKDILRPIELCPIGKVSVQIRIILRLTEWSYR